MIILGVFIVVRVLANGLGFAAWVLAALAAGSYYRFDIWRRPLVSCRACKGSGGNFSQLGGGSFRRPFGKCWCCKGTKSHSRLGARVLAPAQYKAVTEGKHERNY